MNPKYYSKLQEIGQVTRYHSSPSALSQTIAAHSWGVAWLITEFHPNPSVGLIRAALEHDMEEHLTSDVSYNSKILYPPLAEAMDHVALNARKELGIHSIDNLPDDDYWWLKLADLLEGALWSRYLCEEHGVRLYSKSWGRYCKAIEGHTSKNCPDTYLNNPMLRMFITSIQPRGVPL